MTPEYQEHIDTAPHDGCPCMFCGLISKNAELRCELDAESKTVSDLQALIREKDERICELESQVDRKNKPSSMEEVKPLPVYDDDEGMP